MKRPLFAVFASLVVMSACGGAAKQDPKTADTSSKKPDKDDSIADLAARQGGLAALGGAGNREESTGIEAAMGGAGATLHAPEVDKAHPVKLDGVLKEWPARSPAKETISGKTERLTLDVGIQYDDAKLYVAAEIGDTNLVRSQKHGDADDRVVFTIAFPAGRGVLKAYEIGLWPGKPGEGAGVVKWTSGPNAGQTVAGSKIVENDTKGGTVFEAAIPWTSFPESKTMRVGLRGSFRYHDHEGGVLGTGAGTASQPGELPPLPTAAEQAVVDGLLNQKNLAGEKPKIDVYADLAGDERKERISVFGKFFTICGPGYRGGHQFFWREVQGDIASVETRELTGRGKDDLVVKKRITQGNAIHETLEIWSLHPGDEPTTVFAAQIAIVSNDGKNRIINTAKIGKDIEITVEPAMGWNAGTFKETIAGDIEPILLPWGTVKSRTYELKQGKFVKSNEVAQAGTPAPATAQASNQASNQASGSRPQASGRESSSPPDVRGPKPDAHAVYEAYLKDANLPAGTKPKFDLEVHVDGDAKPERVLLVGKDIVVFGPGFKDGKGYARISLSQFTDEKDISELTARDVNGDGSAEIVVRGERHVTSPQNEKVEIEALFIYQVKNGNLARVFGIETGREMTGKRVQGLVQFVPAKGGKGFDIDVRPGTAKGWTEKTYPWPQDKPGSGPIEPLLLPWGKVPNVRYSWNGTTFAAP
jgi:hypothetical protein